MKLIGDKALLAKFKSLDAKVRKTISKPVLKRAGDLVASRAKVLVPKKTGLLAQTIKSYAPRSNKRGASVAVKCAKPTKSQKKKHGKEHYYAKSVEFGHRISRTKANLTGRISRAIHRMKVVFAKKTGIGWVKGIPFLEDAARDRSASCRMIIEHGLVAGIQREMSKP